MKKLEFKDFIAYLPHNLHGWHEERHLCNLSVTFWGYGLANYKPILRPMSDLTREITHKGEKFVPIVELAKTAYEGGEWARPGCYGGIYQCDRNGVYFGYEPDDGSFVVALPDGELVFAPKQRTLFDLLNEWMFDYRDLIGQGLAIDVNTLKENCYE